MANKIKIQYKPTPRAWGMERPVISARVSPGFKRKYYEFIEYHRKKYGFSADKFGAGTVLETAFLQLYPEWKEDVDNYNQEWKDNAHLNKKHKKHKKLGSTAQG